MILVPVFVVFTISLCKANSFECYYYTESSKSLEIYCNSYRNQLLTNCTHESSSIDPSKVTHLKIKECEQNFIVDASKKYSNLESLNISESGYRALDWMGIVFEHVVLLDASSNELNAVPTSILSKFPKLKELRLDGNKIERISADDFENFNRELDTISLVNNGLKFIDDDAFANFRNLSLVNLSRNEFSSFPVEVFKANVREVCLQENPQLTTINCTLIKTMDLKKIYFTWEYITTFDGHCNDNWKFVVSTGNWEYEDLILNSADRSTFYCHISEECFKNIKYFVAGPGSFENVIKMLNLLGPSALEIDLSGNYVGEVNAATFKRFQNLSELSLSNTTLKKFSFDVLHDQIQLIHLDLSENNLEWIYSPEYLENFEQLTYFNAAANQIRNFDQIVNYLPLSVQHLIFSKNQPVPFDIKPFSRLTGLIELNLSDNWFGPKIDIGQLPSTLERLDLHGNDLDFIENLDRKHFPSLKALDISYNKLNCDYSDKLQSEFKDADTIKSDECKKLSKFWIILLASLVSVIIAIIILEKIKRRRRRRRY